MIQSLTFRRLAAIGDDITRLMHVETVLFGRCFALKPREDYRDAQRAAFHLMKLHGALELRNQLTMLNAHCDLVIDFV